MSRDRRRRFVHDTASRRARTTHRPTSTNVSAELCVSDRRRPRGDAFSPTPVGRAMRIDHGAKKDDRRSFCMVFGVFSARNTAFAAAFARRVVHTRGPAGAPAQFPAMLRRRLPQSRVKAWSSAQRVSPSQMCVGVSVSSLVYNILDLPLLTAFPLLQQPSLGCCSARLGWKQTSDARASAVVRLQRHTAPEQCQRAWGGALRQAAAASRGT